MENELLRASSAGQRCNFIFQLFLGIKIMVSLFLYLHGIAQSTRGSRNNGNLMNRCGILLHRRNQSMSHLMISHNQLFLLRHDLIFLLITRNNHFNGFFQVGLNHSFSSRTNGAKSGLIDNVRKFRTGGPGSSFRNRFKIHIVGHLNLLGVYL